MPVNKQAESQVYLVLISQIVLINTIQYRKSIIGRNIAKSKELKSIKNYFSVLIISIKILVE